MAHIVDRVSKIMLSAIAIIELWKALLICDEDGLLCGIGLGLPKFSLHCIL